MSHSELIDALHADRARDFMDGVFELGVAGERAPEVELDWHLGAIDRWELDLEAAAAETFVADEWAGLCRDRSALEFFRALWPEWADRWDLEALDGTLRLRCERDALLDPALIPAGVPRSHWWWWCAQAP